MKLPRLRTAVFLFTCLALPGAWAQEVFVESFENSPGGWSPNGKTTLKSVSVDNGAPEGSVTDGDLCLELTSPNGKEWTQLATQQGLVKEIKEANTLSFDLFVPETSLPDSGWAKVMVRVYGGSGDAATFDLTKTIELDVPTEGGRLYNVSWNYASDPSFSSSVNWAHVSIVTVAEGGTMSPLYIDNFRLENVEGAGASLSSDTFLLGDEWKLVWEDDFSGAAGDAPKDHWKPGAIWQKDGRWRDATLAPEEAYLDGKGNLVMRTRYVDGERLAPYLVTSEEGTYEDEESIKFGPGEHGVYIEWRANVSQFKAHAAWFALWLFSDTPYASDRTKGSEIDVMEYVPFKNDVYTMMNKFNAAVHLNDEGTMSTKPGSKYGLTEFDEDTWHTWGLLWTKDQQIYYLDGKPYWVNDKHVATTDDHGLRMTIEISNGDPEKGDKNNWGHAVGKFEDNPEDRLPSHAFIDYVRVYQRTSEPKL